MEIEWFPGGETPSFGVLLVLLIIASLIQAAASCCFEKFTGWIYFLRHGITAEEAVRRRMEESKR